MAAVLVFSVPACARAGSAQAQEEASGAESPATVIGEIIGPDFTVKGQVGISQREGRVVTRLESGNEVTVHRGQALIRLAGGGSIRLCEPMNVSLLKSAGGLTVAFDRGTVRGELRGAGNLSLHTPWFAIAASRGDPAAGRTIVAGLDEAGKLCLKTLEGEWLVREQLGTGQLVVPAGNDYIIEPNKLTEPRRASDACACAEQNLDEPRLQAKPQAVPASDVAAANTPTTAHTTVSAPEPAQASKPEPAKPAEPEWKAVMPPLVYEAKSDSSAPTAEPAASDASQAPVVLAPATWQGVVASAPSIPAGEKNRETPARTGFVERIKSFFRALFGGRRKSAST